MILDHLFPHPLYAITNPSLTKENNDNTLVHVDRYLRVAQIEEILW